MPDAAEVVEVPDDVGDVEEAVAVHGIRAESRIRRC